VKKIKLLLEEKLTKEGLFDGIRITIIRHTILKRYNTSFDVNYLHPLPKDKMKSDELILLFGKDSKGAIILKVDNRLEWEKEQLRNWNEFRKKRCLSKLGNIL